MQGVKYKNDLEARTLQFAKDIRKFILALPRTVVTIEDGSQLVRSSGSIGANYIEAQEALSKKDFAMRVKISRKEARESRYWLSMLEGFPSSLEAEHKRLVQESTELLKIFNAIVQRV
jgi:four helix bundle protein